jgi:hypothetical protein
MLQQHLVGQGLLIIEASRSHSDTPHSVGLLWTSNQPDAETFVWPLKYLIKNTLHLLNGKQPVIKIKSYIALLRMLLAWVRSYLKQLWDKNFKFLISIIRTYCTYVIQDVRIIGYFSKPEQAIEQKVWETLHYIMHCRRCFQSILFQPGDSMPPGKVIVMAAKTSVTKS